MVLEFVLIAFILLILFSIVVQKSKGLLFVVGTTILFLMVPPEVIIGGKYSPSTIVLILSLIFLFIYKANLQSLKSFPLLKIYSLYVLCLFIIGLSDFDYNFSLNLNTTVIYILNNAFPFLLFYTVFNKNKYFDEYYKIFLLIFFLICVYGIFNFFTEINPLSSLFTENFKIRDLAGDYMSGISTNRKQISSIFFHPYMYSVLLLYLLLYLFTLLKNNKGKVNKNNKIYIFILMILALVNLFMVGSRTSYLIILIGAFFIFFDSFKSLSKLFIIAPIVIVLALQIPQVNEITDSVLDVFESSNTSKTEGSSFEMREQQLLISLKYFVEHPYLGNGIHSIIKKLGYATNIDKRTSDSDAFGFESFLFVLLIEQGLLGFLIHIILFYHIIRYHIRNIAISVGIVKSHIRFNLIFIIGYLIYILGTGTINTLPIFFALIGISVAYQKNYCVPQFYKKSIVEI